jgi:hypothetical protein
MRFHLSALDHLRAPKCEDGDRSDASCLLRVSRKAGVPARLFLVYTVTFLTRKFAHGHVVGFRSDLDPSQAGSGEVVVPARIGWEPPFVAKTYIVLRSLSSASYIIGDRKSRPVLRPR